MPCCSRGWADCRVTSALLLERLDLVMPAVARTTGDADGSHSTLLRRWRVVAAWLAARALGGDASKLPATVVARLALRELSALDDVLAVGSCAIVCERPLSANVLPFCERAAA